MPPKKAAAKAPEPDANATEVQELNQVTLEDLKGLSSESLQIGSDMAEFIIESYERDI